MTRVKESDAAMPNIKENIFRITTSPPVAPALLAEKTSTTALSLHTRDHSLYRTGVLPSYTSADMPST